MRTTLTIDPPVAERIRKRMADRDQTLKSVINEALRAGLRALDAEAQAGERPRFVVKTHRFGFPPGTDYTRLGKLADELEDEEIIAKLRAK
jgi:hypothetical protein